MNHDPNDPTLPQRPRPVSSHPQVIPRDAVWVEEPEPELNVMDYAHLVWAHKWLVVGVLAATLVLTAAWSMTRPKLYRAESKITLHPAPQLTQNQLDMWMSWWQMDRFIADQIQVLQTRSLAQRVVDRLGLDAHPDFSGGDAAEALMSRIGAEPVKDSFVIRVSMTGRDPDTVAEWLNIYVEEFIAANIESSLERTRQVYEVIQSRLDPLREQLTASEQELMRFQEREDSYLFADQDENVIQEQVDTLTREYADAKAERIRVETKLTALRQLRASNLPETGFPEILQDTTIQSLRQQRSDLEVELSDKLRTLKEGHPTIQELRSRIAGVDARIQEQIENIGTSIETDYDIARRREQALYDNIQELRDESIELSKQRLEHDRLQREYEQNKGFLEDMLARSKEADISSTAAANNVRVIEPARAPAGPYSPNLRRSLVLAGLFGLLFGVGLVVFLDFLDQTLRTPDQVERYLGQEVLSALPTLTEDTAQDLREAFQSLRTALLLAARGDGCQVVMVTSAVPEEGKTTVAFNLAKVLATGGSRVLMIDADLRRPRVHRLIDAKNVRGLTSVVLGERAAPEVVHTVAEVPNLDVITSGPLPPNPPELFGKASFRELLEDARATYEWVVIDSPPTATVTDPVMCARLVDMVLLVVQYAGPKRQLVREAIRLLSRTGVRTAGVLLNKVDLERDAYYYSGYYSYYHYGDRSARGDVTHGRKRAG
jgi:capsular exopolysaccharide synthesis family protein